MFSIKSDSAQNETLSQSADGLFFMASKHMLEFRSMPEQLKLCINSWVRFVICLNFLAKFLSQFSFQNWSICYKAFLTLIFPFSELIVEKRKRTWNWNYLKVSLKVKLLKWRVASNYTKVQFVILIHCTKMLLEMKVVAIFLTSSKVSFKGVYVFRSLYMAVNITMADAWDRKRQIIFFPSEVP